MMRPVDFTALADLDRATVTRLADLLEAGYLKPPFTALSLQGRVAGDQARAVAACLDALAAPARTADGPGGSTAAGGERLDTLAATPVPPASTSAATAASTSTAAGIALRAYAAGRAASQDRAAPVEMVASGPDAAAMARDTGVVVRQLFGRARHRVLAVGFAVHQGRTVFKALADRLDADAALDVTLCIDVRRPPGDTSRADQVAARFAAHFVEQEWPGARLPAVYYDPRSLAPAGGARSALHAKCVVVDGEASLVTSANFTEAAQERNIELGVLLHAPPVAAQIETHFRALIRNGRLDRLPLRPARQGAGQPRRGRVSGG